MRKGEQPPWVVSDDLWARIAPLLPVRPRRYRSPGRTAPAGSAGAVRNLVRVAHRDPVGVPAPATRLRVGDDLLVRTAWTGGAPWSTPRTCGRRDAAQKRTEPGRPRPSGQQAPRPDRRRWYPAGR